MLRKTASAEEGREQHISRFNSLQLEQCEKTYATPKRHRLYPGGKYESFAAAGEAHTAGGFIIQVYAARKQQPQWRSSAATSKAVQGLGAHSSAAIFTMAPQAGRFRS